LTSGTIKAMLSGPGVFHEQETNEIHFQEIPSHVLSKGQFQRSNEVKLGSNKVITIICSVWLFRVQSTVYKFGDGNSRVSDCTGSRARVAHGCQFPRLLINTY